MKNVNAAPTVEDIYKILREHVLSLEIDPTLSPADVPTSVKFTVEGTHGVQVEVEAVQPPEHDWLNLNLATAIAEKCHFADSELQRASESDLMVRVFEYELLEYKYQITGLVRDEERDDFNRARRLNFLKTIGSRMRDLVEFASNYANDDVCEISAKLNSIRRACLQFLEASNNNAA